MIVTFQSCVSPLSVFLNPKVALAALTRTRLSVTVKKDWDFEEKGRGCEEDLFGKNCVVASIHPRSSEKSLP